MTKADPRFEFQGSDLADMIEVGQVVCLNLLLAEMKALNRIMPGVAHDDAPAHMDVSNTESLFDNMPV